ncbi:MAG: hypothetical protein JW947_03210 [Sedimentisphaerales bacterium]|nr:hypothetical protein [Sedimentisphaerales bacterium]
MRFTPKRGLFRLVTAAVVLLVTVPIVDYFLFNVMGIIFCTLWLVCWLIGGFIDME